MGALEARCMSMDDRIEEMSTILDGSLKEFGERIEECRAGLTQNSELFSQAVSAMSCDMASLTHLQTHGIHDSEIVDGSHSDSAGRHVRAHAKAKAHRASGHHGHHAHHGHHVHNADGHHAHHGHHGHNADGHHGHHAHHGHHGHNADGHHANHGHHGHHAHHRLSKHHGNHGQPGHHGQHGHHGAACASPGFGYENRAAPATLMAQGSDLERDDVLQNGAGISEGGPHLHLWHQRDVVAPAHQAMT